MPVAWGWTGQTHHNGQSPDHIWCSPVRQARLGQATRQQPEVSRRGKCARAELEAFKSHRSTRRGQKGVLRTPENRRNSQRNSEMNVLATPRAVGGHSTLAASTGQHYTRTGAWEAAGNPWGNQGRGVATDQKSVMRPLARDKPRQKARCPRARVPEGRPSPCVAAPRSPLRSARGSSPTCGPSAGTGPRSGCPRCSAG